MLTRAAIALLPASASVLLVLARGWAAPAVSVAPEDLVFVTDDNAQQFGGCDAISAIDRRRGRAVARGRQYVSPGQIAATTDGMLALAAATNNGRFLAVLRRESQDAARWTSASVAAGVRPGSAVAISPDDSIVLLNTPGGALEAHNLVRLAGGNASSPIARADVGAVADMVFSRNGRLVYVVTTVGEIHILESPSLSAVRPSIKYPPVTLATANRLRNTHASLSPSGEILVVNTAGPTVTVVRLDHGSVASLSTPGLRKTYGLAFNYAVDDDAGALLAVHGRSAVAVYRLRDTAALELAARASVPPQDPPTLPGAPDWSRVATLAWTGAGDGLVAAVGGKKEFRVLQYDTETSSLTRSFEFDSCEATLVVTDYDQQFDVLTLHDRLHTRPPTPTSPTATATRLATATPAATGTPTRTATHTGTPTETSRPTPTTRPMLAPLYLPVSIKERCATIPQRSDVALVLDTSSSMTGQKLEDAKSAAQAFIGMIDLDPGRSQVSVVRYDREAEVVRELTRARTLIDAAIRSLRVRSGTHIDKGLRAALGELQSPRHLERNTQVMILLTDGLQTGTPGEELRAAEEVRDAGVRLYTIGLGADVDETALKTMAGDESRYYHAPDSADLAKIYAEIAEDLMCPGKELWGGR